MRTKQLPSDKELLVLQLLRDGPPNAYGLELVKASNGRLGRASIYVTLGRMETKGFIKRHIPSSAGGHPGLPRPLYRVTALGEKALLAAEAAREAIDAAMARASI
jgi:DNA-binding PadR family transcriptional regulator